MPSPVIIRATTPHSDSLQVGESTSSEIGFFGATPVARPAGAAQAAATDAASTQALANALRTALVNLGLIKGSA